jgi:hypothetical protein
VRAGLGRDRGHRGRDCVLVAEIRRISDRERGARPLREAVATRSTGGDVDLGDVVIGDALEMLQKCPKAVAVGGDEYVQPGE